MARRRRRLRCPREEDGDGDGTGMGAGKRSGGRTTVPAVLHLRAASGRGLSFLVSFLLFFAVFSCQTRLRRGAGGSGGMSVAMRAARTLFPFRARLTCHPYEALRVFRSYFVAFVTPRSEIKSLSPRNFSFCRCCSNPTGKVGVCPLPFRQAGVYFLR